MGVLAAVVAVLSIAPTLNMLSPRQVMNTSFNPLQIVNTYGAFGSVTKERYEIVIEGTSVESPAADTDWREYEFRGKPGDPSRTPPLVAPYHMRLDWLMWFAAMSSPSDYPWFSELVLKLLQGDRPVLGLLRDEPVSRPSSGVDARRVVSLSLHDARGASADGALVGPPARRRVFPRRSTEIVATRVPAGACQGLGGVPGSGLGLPLFGVRSRLASFRVRSPGRGLRVGVRSGFALFGSGLG